MISTPKRILLFSYVFVFISIPTGLWAIDDNAAAIALCTVAAFLIAPAIYVLLF
jgi:hypothetical protein